MKKAILIAAAFVAVAGAGASAKKADCSTLTGVVRKACEDAAKAVASCKSKCYAYDQHCKNACEMSGN